MKKSSKTSSKGSLKKIKDEIESCFCNEKFEDAIPFCQKMIKLFPKNVYGYVSFIKAYTHDYNKYFSIDDLKEVKKTYETAYQLSSKNDKIKLKQAYDDYLYDIKEVDNLNKIKKEIISKEFLKNIYNDALTFINQNLNTAGLYGKANSRIRDVYDFIKGLFLFCCLIYNLTFCNYLLILTVPFGIFGFINMYSFVEMNFFDKGKYKIEKATFEKLVNNANDKISNLKQEINKINDNLDFLREQKLSSISRIPELFSKDIESLLLNDEVKLAEQISEALLSSDMVKFTYLLEENTNLNPEDVINSLSNELNSKEDELSKYINDKLSERKNNQSKAMLMKKVKPIKAIFLVIALFISISSIIILINNFYEMNLYAFVVSMVVGAISMFIYNVDTGKHASLSDTFNDNLLVTVFNSTIVYDLIYSKLNNGLSITYGFLQIPLTFILIFMGFVLLVSSIKYIYLLKKLRS